MSVDPTDPALVAAVDEAVETAKATVEWQGVKVVIPIADLDDVDADALDALENSATSTFLRTVLGSGAYEQARRDFETINGHRPSIGEIAGDKNPDSEKSKASLAGAVLAYYGFRPGEM